jgi:hypothetical protein
MSVLKSVILALLINRLTFRMKKQYTSIQSVYTLYIYIYISCMTHSQFVCVIDMKL